MINFARVYKNLYRGSAPSEEEVKELHDKLGIKRIISLDNSSGKYINKICKKLGIEHFIFPLNGKKEPLLKLLKKDLKELFLSDVPTFVHCRYGKDRTGMIVGILRCKYMDYSCHDALREARFFGFGQGLGPAILNFYSTMIRKSCSKEHDHKYPDVNFSIVDESRDKVTGDPSSSILDSADRKSFAPMLDSTRQYPSDSLYRRDYDQSHVRNNGEVAKENAYNVVTNKIPQVGMYDNTSGTKGFGPVEIGGGFATLV